MRFVLLNQQGGKLGDKMLVAGLSAFRETFNIEATKLQSHGVEVDLLLRLLLEQYAVTGKLFYESFYGKWLPYGEFYQLSILGAGDFLIAILAMEKKSESQKRFAFFICSNSTWRL